MLAFISVIHVLLCFFMIFVILLQPGKDAGMGAALGGGAASSAFGGRGAVTVLTKLTAIFAALFFLTSLGLSFVGLRSSVAAGSVAGPTSTQTPAAKEASPAAGGTSPLPSAPQQNAAPDTGLEQGSNPAPEAPKP